MTTVSGHRYASPTTTSTSALSPQLLPRSTSEIKLERESTCQSNENERRLMFLSMITYPAHLTTTAQEELQRPSYKSGNVPSLPLTVKAFNELWRHAFRNDMIRRQDLPQRSRGGHRVDAMHVDMASDIDDD
eukprot:3674943-Pleurochrysis_carterae.AAC.1